MTEQTEINNFFRKHALNYSKEEQLQLFNRAKQQDSTAIPEIK